ncbi:MAG: hypothetical protein ACOX6T_18085 [Myxococcales bacterium]
MSSALARIASNDAQTLEREAATILADALALLGTLHLPGVRDEYRQKLERAIDLAEQALACADGERLDRKTAARARSTLVKAHTARAFDALHGANQLSMASQRAPTPDDCDDGWQRVAEIVAVAEESACEAARFAASLDKPSAAKDARKAEAAARKARRILEARNRAYTFHTDPRFSFGEGWYAAAAALLAGVEIQIEPGKALSAQAERFLRDAGLESKVVPYRPRPPANKPLPEIVARAFRADPLAAQRKLRAAFLGDEPIPRAIVDWTERTLAGAPAIKKVLLWIRHGSHQPERNTAYPELRELSRRALDAGLVPILIGDALRGGEVPAGAFDMTLFWKLPLFQGPDMRRAQLQLFEHLKSAHSLVGQLGVTTAGMDGPALMGLPTMYLTDAPNVRLGRWVGAVPGYEEVVREGAYLERISETLRRWANGGSTRTG